MRKKVKYLFNDLFRLIQKKELYLSIIGVACVLNFSTRDGGGISKSVLWTMLYSTYGVGFILSFVFCALPYATVFCEELETQYVKYAVIRGNLKYYIFSKILIIFSSSILVMSAGCVLFAVCCSVRLPWIDADTLEQVLNTGGYSGILKNNMYILWFVLYGIQWGVYAGCLSLISAYVSLYMSNKLLVLAVPAFTHQLIIELVTNRFSEIEMFNPLIVFDARYNIFGSDVYMILWFFLIGGCYIILAGYASYKKMKKRM